ncbi:MAG: hypothetical protein HYY52_01455 [Candidatus Melainabacteria bacterium]|nr:hypothetical protein [Candidatus Melainabacteria bacterium]
MWKADKQVKTLVRNSILSNQAIGAFLIFMYCAMYGISAQVILNGLELIYFMASLLVSLTVVYIRDPEVQKERAKRGIVLNQLFGTGLVFAYIITFGISSITLLNGFKLLFFMSSYVFAMSLIYIRDPDRIKKSEDISSSITTTPFFEKNPCFINNKDLSWLIRELNSSLSTIIGFSELMINREYNQSEKEYMTRSIYENAIRMSYSINKASSLISDSITKPKATHDHEVVDMLQDKNLSK